MKAFFSSIKLSKKLNSIKLFYNDSFRCLFLVDGYFE